MTERLTILSTDGLALEAELDAATGSKASLLLCHPHPKMGGTMNAPLLLAVRDEMLARGWTVLRFNFRGVGSSQGERSTGVEEVADAQGGLDRLRDRSGTPLAIAGWSFGAAVALRATARNSDLVGCAALAPSVQPRSNVSAGLPPARDLGLAVPVLVVVGANDDVVDPDAVREWTSDPDGVKLEVIPGANHFFWARYERLSGVVGDFLDGCIRGGDGE